jgi:hypothetical protein
MLRPSPCVALGLLLLARSPVGAENELTVVPSSLPPVAWGKGPAAVLSRADPGEGLVWLGIPQAARFEATPDGTRLTLLCRYLEVAEPSAETLATHTFRAHRPEPAYFVATIEIDAPEHEAQKMLAAILGRRHYALAAGRYATSETWGGHRAVVLETHRLEVSDSMRVTIAPSVARD